MGVKYTLVNHQGVKEDLTRELENILANKMKTGHTKTRFC